MAELDLDELADRLHQLQHSSRGKLPNKVQAERFLNETLELIFPNIIGDAEPCSRFCVRQQIVFAEEALERALEPIQPSDRNHTNPCARFLSTILGASASADVR